LFLTWQVSPPLLPSPMSPTMMLFPQIPNTNNFNELISKYFKSQLIIAFLWNSRIF
jgi:hypothetical protein